MKKNFLFLFTVFYSFVKLMAQNNLPPVYEIKTDTALEQHVDTTYYQVLEDKEGKWTFDQVSHTPLSNQFHSRSAKLKGIDTAVNTHWFRYRIRNAMGKETKITLNAPGPQSDFYVSSGTSLPKHFVSGEDIPWSKKDGYKRLNALPFNLSRGEEMVVYERTSDYFTGITPDFSIGPFKEKYIEKQADTIASIRIEIALFKGVFLLGAFFNFFFF